MWWGDVPPFPVSCHPLHYAHQAHSGDPLLVVGRAQAGLVEEAKQGPADVCGRRVVGLRAHAVGPKEDSLTALLRVNGRVE